MDRVLFKDKVLVTIGEDQSFRAELELVDTGSIIRLRLKVGKNVPELIDDWDDIRLAPSSPAGKDALDYFNRYANDDLTHEQVLAFYRLEPVREFRLWRTWPFYLAAIPLHWANYVIFGDREALREVER